VESKSGQKPDLEWLDKMGRLLDTQFKIPGTNFRFGLDPIFGLFIPYVGDLITYSVSGMLIFYMARHGASGKLVLKMLFNVSLDLLIGGIPIAGELGDFILRANDRNIAMYREYIEEGKHSGSGIGIIIAVLLVLIAIPVIFIVVAFKALVWLKDWIFEGI